MKHDRKNNGRDKHQRHSYSCTLCHPHKAAGNGDEKWRPSEARRLREDKDEPILLRLCRECGTGGCEACLFTGFVPVNEANRERWSAMCAQDAEAQQRAADEPGGMA